MAGQDERYPTFGADYVPPAERIRQQNAAMDAQFRAQATGSGALQIKPVKTRWFTIPDWMSFLFKVGLTVVVLSSLVFFKRCMILAGGGGMLGGSAPEENAAACKELEDSLAEHVTISAAPRRGAPKPPGQAATFSEEELGDVARHYREFSDEVDSLEFDIAELDELRADLSDSVHALSIAYCPPLPGTSDCGFPNEREAALHEGRLEGFLRDYNRMCAGHVAHIDNVDG